MYSIFNRLLGNAGENGEYFEYINNPIQREAYLNAVEQGELNDWKESVGYTKKMVGKWTKIGPRIGQKDAKKDTEKAQKMVQKRGRK